MPEYEIKEESYPADLKLPVSLNIEFMIDTLAEAHGVSKRTIENEYTRYDYFIFVTRKNLEIAKFESKQEKKK